MLQYLVRRLVLAAVTLLGITLVTFSVIQLAPGDPAELKALSAEGSELSEKAYEELRAYYGLDRPLLEQYLSWLWRLVTLDLGNSFDNGEKVLDRLLRALPPTLAVGLVSLAAALALSLPIGILSAVRQGGAFDRLVSTALYLLYSVPAYVLAIVLILVVSVKFDLLPFRGMYSDDHDELSLAGKAWDVAKHAVLIVVCYTYPSLAYYSRFVRQNLLEVIRQDYIRTARAKGLSEARVVLKHALANTLIPFITLLGLTLPSILSGAVILEAIFNWPGMGSLFIDSVYKRDYPVVMALNFLTAVLVLAGTLLADLAYGLVDPRVRHD
jgi:peptide/nickel transport system permease protein